MTDFPSGDDPVEVGRLVIIAASISPHDYVSLLANALILAAMRADVSQVALMDKIGAGFAETRRALN